MEHCFYCGSSEHPSSKCVQKGDIQDIPQDALNLLGYSSTSEIAELISMHKEGTINLASKAIYELSYEFRREYDEKLWQEKRVENLLDYVISITRGYVNIESDNPERGLKEFSGAFSLAPNELYQTRAHLLKSRVQYVLGDIDGVIETITQANTIILPDDAPDEEKSPIRFTGSPYDYRLAAYYAAKGESEISLHYLRSLIEGDEDTEGDRLYFVKTQVDAHFDNVRSQVDAFLGELLEDKKKIVVPAMEIAESAIESTKEWAVDIKPADVALEQAKQKYNTDSYFGYLDAVKPAQKAREFAENAEKEQRTNLAKNASHAIEKAQNAIERITTALGNLRNPAKQLTLPYEPHEHIKIAQEKLADANENSAQDNYSGYLLAEEKATEASEMVSEMQNKATEFLQLEEEAEIAIADTRVALQMFAVQLREEDKTDEISEKLRLAQTTLKEAQQTQKSYSKEGYEKAIDMVQTIHQLMDEMRQEVELKNLEEAVMKDIEGVAIVLQNIETQFQEQFNPDTLEYAQTKLEEARVHVGLKTEEGYQKAMEETRQANQLSDEVKQDFELQNMVEIAQRGIETAAASMLELKTEYGGRFDTYESDVAQAELEEVRTIIVESEELSIDECQQAIEKINELQREIEQLILVAEEESQRKSRNIKTGIVMAGIALIVGTTGSLISPLVGSNFVIPGACLLIGVACYCSPFLINWIEEKRKGED